MSPEMRGVSLRNGIGAFVALLLPLPMVLLLARVLPLGMPEEERIYGRRVAPVLKPQERLQLRSHHRNCRKGTDCEFPLGCLPDARAGATYCSDSKCVTDMQCLEGQVCRPLLTYGNGPVVRICIPAGLRDEGEQCVRVGSEPDDACQPDLICGGKDGLCARPCNLEDPTGCPENFFCADTVPEPLCLPTCEKSGCPEGQHCIQYEEGASACAKVYGVNCQQNPCLANQKCELDFDSSRPATVWMHCAQSCRKDPSSCPPGLICNGWSCHPPCNPEGPNTCAEGYRCKKARPTRPWVCLPDW